MKRCRNILLLLSILFILIMVPFSCKKYGEDPFPKAKWDNPFIHIKHYEAIIINGKDVTDLYSDSMGIDIRKINLNFHHYNRRDNPYYINHEEIGLIVYTDTYGGQISVPTNVRLCCNFSGISLGRLYLNCNVNWEIRRTVGNLVIIQRKLNGNTYRIIFTKKK